MDRALYDQAKGYLLQALDDPNAEFREGQWDAIQALARDRRKLLVVQRTGWGKSIVYFLATRLLRDQGAGATLLISPLLALMRNQIEAAKRIGIRAHTINSSNQEDWANIEQELLAGRVDILLISPERLANDDFRQRVLSRIAGRVGMLAVDEAHCISDWGHDFRPDYKRIARIIQAMPPNVPILGTTATANDRVVEDVVNQLGDDLQVVRGPLARKSLRLQNIYLPTQAERMAWLAARLLEIEGSGIVYTRTVRDANLVAAWLRLNNIEAHAYHSEIAGERRIELENALLANHLKVLVATSALGMGFDKPDLAFVIHYQRPGLVVEYYQQVGRARRGIHNAYGIMLSGDEDDEITDYFIRTAFPPEAHVDEILRALEDSDTGLSLTSIEEAVNLRRSQIERALKILSVMTPSPVVKQGSVWSRTPIAYERDQEKIDKLIAIRKAEQSQMKRYLASKTCLMSFLRHALDDPIAEPCGRCAACLGRPLLSENAPTGLVNAATIFLQRSDQPIRPRKQFPDKHVALTGKRAIDDDLRAEEGRALSRWGDSGWGKLVQYGKFRDNHFSDELVDAMAEMITSRWKPTPYPTWITAVPSRRNPALVRSFAERLAARLGLPLIECIEKVADTKPQKEMHNSYQQYMNICDAFTTLPIFPQGEPVFLIDDMVDSAWTFTVLSVLLRRQGSGPVYPTALAVTTADL
jgi:ATP-dependent DNA helicase RecQ